MKFALIVVCFLSSSIMAAEEGRYKLYMNKEFSAQSILLDTKTGKMWKQACYAGPNESGTKCAVEAWTPQDIIGITVTEKEKWDEAVAYEKKQTKQ